MKSYTTNTNIHFIRQKRKDSCGRTIGVVDNQGTIRNKFGQSTFERVDGYLVKDLTGNVVGTTTPTFTTPEVKCPKW